MYFKIRNVFSFPFKVHFEYILAYEYDICMFEGKLKTF